ncbi:MAG: BatA domain-containing protein [Blastocatellia bacterium]
MSFLNPLFLLGLAAVAAPIIVHLVRRTKAPRVEFPSLMFVRRVPQKTIRKRMVQNWLLLALRCLAFLLLALAFVRPYFGSGEANEGQGKRANIILLDTSFSMRFGKRFDQAKARAQTILDQTAGSESAALVTFGQSYEAVAKFTTDGSKLKAALDGVKVGYGSTDYVQALRGAAELFKEIGLKDRRIVLISDFQAAGRNPAESAFQLGKDIKLVTMDVGEAQAANLAVTDVGARALIYQPKYEDKLTARVANFSDETRVGVRVEFLLNERTVEKRELKIAANDSATVEFTGFNLNEGINRCEIKIEGDDFPFDNRFYFTLRRADQLKALLIETASRGRSESFYFRNAMTTGENLPFDVESKTAGSVNPGELSQYRVAILNDAMISPALANGLAKFVEAGGGLIIAAGSHTEASSFNQVFQNIAPAKLEEKVLFRGGSGGDYVTMSEIKTDHPIFEPFRQSGRLASARVFGYHRATSREGSVVLARYEDGNPALIEATHGTGKILLFTSTFDTSWNDLPLTPLYLPLIRQMTRHLGEREERAWHLLGQSFTVAAAKDGSIPAVDQPSGERLTERKQTPTGELIITAKEPGFYRLRFSDTSDFAAVNVDTKESDLAKLNLEEFVTAITGADPKAQTAAAANEKLSNEEIESRQRVWWWLLVVALALFLTEAILSRRTRMAKVIG